ncbi:transporter substrate-binding domain-containing protein [Psychromonas sp. MME2]|uniref:substrate-binding periplasmic protein n=1 Tax=Psychromonas sp. MME2 TaxID=3231033 RepID=UPI00339C5334
MLQRKWITMLLITCNLLITAQVKSSEIVINNVSGEKETLVVDILKLILSKSDPQVTIRQYPEALPTSRLEDEVKLGNIDVMWAGINNHLDESFMTVRIPILKGLLGHRIFIIRKDQQSKFNNVKTLDDLKKLNAGQGTQWGDTAILKAASVPVITTLKYPNLFYMLEGGRFDYFPRAIHEPWSEVASRPELNLTVEKNIMLVYPFAMYFFVEKNNQALHEKLTQGFEMAIADGSFDELFFSNQQIKDALSKTHFKNRIIIKIPNGAMHPDTPIDCPELWLDPTSL